MERQLSQTYAGVAETLAASCRLEPRWDEKVGEGVPDHHQLVGALLYTSLPYYRLRPELRDQMSANARKLFDELEPVVRRGVHGSPEDAFEAALAIARRFEQAGLVQEPDQNAVRLSEPPPMPSGAQPGRSQAGQGAGGRTHQEMGRRIRRLAISDQEMSQLDEKETDRKPGKPSGHDGSDHREETEQSNRESR